MTTPPENLTSLLRAWRKGDPAAFDEIAPVIYDELHRLDEAVPLRDRLRPLQERVLNRPATGLEADKAFYDELSGNE